MALDGQQKRQFQQRLSQWYRRSLRSWLADFSMVQFRCTKGYHGDYCERRPDGTYYRAQIRRKGQKVFPRRLPNGKMRLTGHRRLRLRLLSGACSQKGEAHAVRSDSQVHERDLTQVQTRDGREETSGASLVGEATWEGLSSRHRRVLNFGGASKSELCSCHIQRIHCPPINALYDCHP